jgi:hypothetical protein
MMVATGPMMTAGPELAEAASQALSVKMEFQSISEYVLVRVYVYHVGFVCLRSIDSREEAKKILSSEQGEEIDDAEKEYLLEYYSLIREGKTNYTATAAFQAIFGHRGQEVTEFFKVYEVSSAACSVLCYPSHIICRRSSSPSVDGLKALVSPDRGPPRRHNLNNDSRSTDSRSSCSIDVLVFVSYLADYVSIT